MGYTSRCMNSGHWPSRLHARTQATRLRGRWFRRHAALALWATSPETPLQCQGRAASSSGGGAAIDHQIGPNEEFRL